MNTAGSATESATESATGSTPGSATARSSAAPGPAGNDPGRVHLTRQGEVACLRFDRPAARNAMTWSMYEALAGHCEALARDPQVRVLVLRGSGGEAFVAGTDIAQFQAFGAGPAGGADGVAYEQQIDAVVGLLERVPMPTIACVEGWAVGGGLALATACDFRIATPSARFAVPIARTLGNLLSVANLARLTAAWGQGPVRRMLLLAEVLGAEEALRCGYLLQICAAEALDEALGELSHRLARLAPLTQAASKEGLRRLTTHALPADDDWVRRCYGSADFREGVQAFVDRRPPVWRGQ